MECLAQEHWDIGVATRFDLFSIGPKSDVVDRATTDATGRAAFHAPLRASYRFVATKAGLARGVSPFLRLIDSADARDLVIRLDRAYRFTGRVADGRGNPLEGALVLAGSPEFTWNHRFAEPPLRATTGADGTFAFDALPPRDLSLWAA